MSESQQDNFDAPITIKTFCQNYSWPSEPAMRAYRQRARELNLSDAFLTIKRRVLVRPKTFFRLIEQHHQHEGYNYDVKKSTCLPAGTNSEAG